MLTNGRADNAQHHPECLLLVNSQSKFGNMLLPVPNAPIAHCKDNLFRRLGRCLTDMSAGCAVSSRVKS